MCRVEYWLVHVDPERFLCNKRTAECYGLTMDGSGDSFAVLILVILIVLILFILCNLLL